MPRRTNPPLIVALALLPIALAGCMPEDGAKSAAEARQPGDSWILMQQGERPAEKQKPAPAPIEEEDEAEPPHLEPVHAEKPEPQDPRCLGAHAPGWIATVAVQPAATTATVTWYHPGDPTVTGYQVTAISQDLVPGTQPEIGWTPTEPGEAGCRELTATVTDLQPGTPYVFSVDAVRQPTWHNGTRTATVARSGVVTTR